MICGLDEVGCGPLAGPVVAAAAVLPEDFPVELLKDSKELSEKKREALYPLIQERAIAFATAWIEPEEIDRINIRQAALKAMSIAFEEVRRRLPLETQWLCLVDGNQRPPIDVECQTIVKGDRLIPSIMAASILAKVQRDRYMVEMDKLYPHYGFAQHKGYPTAAHKEACRKWGPCPLHRRSFRLG